MRRRLDPAAADAAPLEKARRPGGEDLITRVVFIALSEVEKLLRFSGVGAAAAFARLPGVVVPVFFGAATAVLHGLNVSTATPGGEAFAGGGGFVLTAALAGVVRRLIPARRSTARPDKLWKAVMEQPDDLAVVVTEQRGDDEIIVDWSRGAERVFKRPRAEALGLSVCIVHGDHQRGNFLNVYRRMREERAAFRATHKFQRADGDPFEAIFTTHPVLDDAGRVVASVGVALDVSEETRRSRELHFQAEVLNQIHDFVTVTDLEGRIQYVNRVVEAALRTTRSDLIGRSVETYGDTPEQKARQRYVVEQAKRDGEWRGEVVNAAPDGSRVVLDCRVRVMHDERGKPFALCGVSTDVTERKRAEKALAESENRFQNMLQRVELIAVMLDRDARITFCNKHLIDLSGWPEDALLGRSWLETFIPPEDYDRIKEVFGATIQSGDFPPRHQNPIRLRNGELREIRWSNSIMLGENGAVTGVASIGEDVTEEIRVAEERLEMERRMLETQKLESLGVLAGGIAHDFNNLLMAVLGHADLALEEAPDGSALEENLHEIERASRRAAELCNQMLAYSGRGQFLIRTVDLNRVLLEMTGLLKTSIHKKTRMTLALGPEPLWVQADVTQLRQILMNVIVNASEALGEGDGAVSVRTFAGVLDAATLATARAAEDAVPGEYASVEVVDTGCGMDEATRLRIFEPFFTTKFLGRGLGMAATLGIVRSHRGALELESEVGRGTTIRVHLPRSDVPSPQDAAASPKPEAEEENAGRTVLLTDDDETVLRLGQRMLERLGCRVLTARDGREAVETFRQRGGEIHAVILDLTMPRMDGQEAAAEMLRLRPGLPILVSSGYAEQEVAERFAGLSLSGFLQKPYVLLEMRNALRKLFERVTE